MIATMIKIGEILSMPDSLGTVEILQTELGRYSQNFNQIFVFVNFNY